MRIDSALPIIAQMFTVNAPRDVTVQPQLVRLVDGVGDLTGARARSLKLTTTSGA
jgi:hypothetical protein